MAARKEILDFIMLERTTTPPKHEEIENHLFRILEIYNNREADCITLQNDLFELVSSCKLYERAMKTKHTKYDFELVIMGLIQTAIDWQIFLPETEIKRYEEVRLNVVENLADYIRKKYSFHAKDDKTTFEELKEEWEKGKPKLIIIRLKEKGIITANGDVYNWKIDNKHGYSKSLYVYFVYKASEKLEWRKGKKKDIIPWSKFNPIFPNVSDNQNSRNADLRDIKKGISMPSLAQVIDDILNW